MAPRTSIVKAQRPSAASVFSTYQEQFKGKGTWLTAQNPNGKWDVEVPSMPVAECHRFSGRLELEERISAATRLKVPSIRRAAAMKAWLGER